MLSIDNRDHEITRSECPRIEELPQVLESKVTNGSHLLRWYISNADQDRFVVETTMISGQASGSHGPLELEDLPLYPGKSAVVSIVPTGVGCSIGGYAADAAPATALLASCCDYLVTNPNAVNASNFISMPDNILYSEGYMIDRFCQGELNLYRPYSNKVGLIIEATSEENVEVVMNIVNTVRAIHGVNLEYYIVTDKLIGGRCRQTGSGAYVGTIDNPGVLFEACEYLIGKGVDAIGVTTNIQDLPMDNYAKHFNGEGHPNPVGGAEAVISHSICRKYKVPTAHAPMINVKEMELNSRVVDARGAGEFASVSGLACVLIGLANAPQINEEVTRFRIKDALNLHNVLAVVAPAGSLGGIPVFAAARHGIPVIAVKENTTILDVTADKLGLENVIPVNNYPEAAGVIQALRNGIALPSLHRPLETLHA